MKYWVVVVMFVPCLFGSFISCDKNGNSIADSNNQNDQKGTMKTTIKITVDETVITATLNNTKAARNFINQLPLTVTLNDYAATEKIFYPPDKLSTAGAPSGYDPSIGDIAYYAPWGNIAIFYKDFGYSNGLIELGKIDNNGIQLLNVSGNITAKFEVE